MNLDELEELEKEASPGPWTAYPTLPVVAECAELYGPKPPGLDDGIRFENQIDAHLIAAMRNALPHLIKEVRTARKLVEVVVSHLSNEDNDIEEMGAIIAALSKLTDLPQNITKRDR